MFQPRKPTRSETVFKVLAPAVLLLGIGFVGFQHYKQQGERGAEKTDPRPRDGASPAAASLTKVTFTANWFAQTEHGGFYQAKALGIYERHGLDVTLRQGNAQVNGPQLLMSGGTDFFMGSGFEAIKAVEEGIPIVTVAAIFQKDPQVLIAHAGEGNDTLAQMRGKPVMVSATALTSFWPFLVAKHGFDDAQRRPYNFSIAPFLADKKAIQQGYLTSEPFTIEKQGGAKPVVVLLADSGYLPYATTIETTREKVTSSPDVVRRFVAASSEGWARYLEDPAPANALIKADNPEMGDDLMAYSLAKMKELGLVLSGDARTLGIGAMTRDRWKAFHEDMAAAQVFKTGTDFEKAFTLEFMDSLTRPAAPAQP